MNKNCPNCGLEMPEEASFCLNCFTENIGIADDFDDLKSTVPIKSEKCKKLKNSSLKPPVIRSIAGTLAAVMILLIFAQSFRKAPNGIELEHSSGNAAIQNTLDDTISSFVTETESQKDGGFLENIIDNIFDKNKEEKTTGSQTEPDIEDTATTAPHTTLPNERNNSKHNKKADDYHNSAAYDNSTCFGA